jgi:hypothetical protein
MMMMLCVVANDEHVQATLAILQAARVDAIKHALSTHITRLRELAR